MELADLTSSPALPAATEIFESFSVSAAPEEE